MGCHAGTGHPARPEGGVGSLYGCYARDAFSLQGAKPRHFSDWAVLAPLPAQIDSIKVLDETVRLPNRGVRVALAPSFIRSPDSEALASRAGQFQSGLLEILHDALRCLRNLLQEVAERGHQFREPVHRHLQAQRLHLAHLAHVVHLA